MSGTRRLQKELLDLQKEPIPGISAAPEKPTDLYRWKGTIQGPCDTPYAGGTFHLTLNVPNTYPLQPPKVFFNTKIFHPNVVPGTGAICLDILGKEWSPVLNLATVLLSVSSLLMDPNPDDPSESSPAAMYRNDRMKFMETAREWTKQHAM